MPVETLTPLDLQPFLLREVLLLTVDGAEYVGTVAEIERGRVWLQPSGVVRVDRIVRVLSESTEVAAARERIRRRLEPLYRATANAMRAQGEPALAAAFEEIGQVRRIPDDETH